MKATRLAIPDVILLEPKVFGDDRGFFFESYNREAFRQATGLDPDFVQDNHSRSVRGTLRGLHAQLNRPQGKLIRVIEGEIFDVAVDIRRGSPTFGKWVGAWLSAENFHQLYIPTGFVHGFYVTSETAQVQYKCTDYYDPTGEITVLWNDPALGIEWPDAGVPRLLSAKDEAAPLLADAPRLFREASIAMEDPADWRGLVMDSSRLNIRFIKKDFIYWKYDLTAMHSFITAENINGIIAGYTSNNDPGLLSIDIDGNDYWVWEAISCIQPRVVICEYNAVFGSDHAVSIPYNPAFIKNKAHYSCLYFGASLPALCLLAEKKGYDFIGTSAAGVNAFFIRKDLSAPFVHYTAKTGFHASANRDSKDEKGNNSFLPFAQRLEMIKHLPVTEVSSGSNYLIKDLYKI